MPVATTSQLNTAVANFLKSNSSLAALYRTASPATIAAAAKTNPQLQSALSGFLPSGTTVAAPAATAKPATTTPAATTAKPATTTPATKQYEMPGIATGKYSTTTKAFTLPDPSKQITNLWAGNDVVGDGKTVTDPATGTTYYLTPSALGKAQWYGVPKGSTLASPVTNPTTQPTLSNSGQLTVATLNKNINTFFTANPMGNAAFKAANDTVAAQKAAREKAIADKAAAEAAEAAAAEALKSYIGQLNKTTNTGQVDTIVAEARKAGIIIPSSDIESAKITAEVRNADLVKAKQIEQDFAATVKTGKVTPEQLKAYRDQVTQLGGKVNDVTIEKADTAIVNTYRDQLERITKPEQVDTLAKQAQEAGYPINSFYVDRARTAAEQTQTNYAKAADWIKTNTPTGGQRSLPGSGQAVYSIPANPVTGSKGGWYRSVETGPGKYFMQEVGADGAPTGPLIPSEEWSDNNQAQRSQIQNYNKQNADTVKAKKLDYTSQLSQAKTSADVARIVDSARTAGLNLNQELIDRANTLAEQTPAQLALKSPEEIKALFNSKVNEARTQADLDRVTQQAKAAGVTVSAYPLEQATQRVAFLDSEYAKTAEFIKTNKPQGIQAGSSAYGVLSSLADDPTTSADESGWYRAVETGPGDYDLQRIGADGRPTGPVIPNKEYNAQKNTIQTNTYEYKLKQENTARMQDFLARKADIESKLPAPGEPGFGGFRNGPSYSDRYGRDPINLEYRSISPNVQTGAGGAWAVSTDKGKTWKPVGQSGVVGEPNGPSISAKEANDLATNYTAYVGKQAQDRRNALIAQQQRDRNSSPISDLFAKFDDLVNDTIGWKTIATIAGSAIGGPWGAALANATAGAVAGEEIGDIARSAALTFATAYGTQALGEALSSSANAAADAGIVDSSVADTLTTGVDDVIQVSPELDPGAYIPEVSPELDPGAYIPEPVAPVIPDVPVVTGPVIPEVPVELPQPITDEFGEIISYETPSEIVNNINTNAPVEPPFGPPDITDVVPVTPGPVAPEIVTNDVGERFVLNPDGTMTPYQDPNIINTPGLPTTEPVLTPVGTPTVEIMEPVAPTAPPPVSPAEQYFKDLVDGGMDIKQASDLTDLRFPRSDIPTEVEITGVGVTNPTAPELIGTGPVGPVAPSDLPPLITYGGLQPGEIIATLTPEQIAIMGGSAAALATVTAVISAGGNPATVIPSATATPTAPTTTPTTPTTPVTPEPVIAPVEPPPVITPEPVAPPVTPVEPAPVVPPVAPEPVPVETPVIPVVTPPITPPVPPVEPVPVTPTPVEPPITPPVEPVPVVPPVTPPGPVIEPPGPVIEPPGPVIEPPGPVIEPPGPVIEPPGPVVPPVVAPPGPVTPPGPVGPELPPGPPGPVTPGPVVPPVVTPPVVTPPVVTPPVVTPPAPPVTEPPKPFDPWDNPEPPVKPELPNIPTWPINLLPIIFPPVRPPNMPPSVPYDVPYFPGTKLVNSGLNPGWVVTGVNPPMYQTTNPYQSQYYWGKRPLMQNMADLAKYNQVPEAPAVPFGLQAGPNFDWDQYLAQLAQTPVGPVAPGTGTA